MAKAKLKWYLLKQNKCPKCSAYLQDDENHKGKFFICSSCLDFKITEKRFREITTEQSRQSVDSFMDHQERKREGWE